jgi:hypothetical protein
MKKLFFIALFTTVNIVLAVGPKVPCILFFTPNPPNEQVTGYWFYWNTGTVQLDTQRLALSTNAWSGFDLRVLGLPQGDYNYWVSATNFNGGEGAADMLPWHFHTPSKTGSTIKTP